MFKKLSIYIIPFLLFAGTSTSLAQETCEEGTAISAAQVVNSVLATCCQLSKSKKLKKCIQGALKLNAPKYFGEIFGGELVGPLSSLLASNCGDEIVPPACTVDTSLTIDEFETNMEGACCNLKKRTSRQKCLIKARAFLNRAKQALSPTDFRAAAKTVLKNLLRAKSCGKGGKGKGVGSGGGGSGGTKTSGCGSFNDGPIVGRVWKPFSDKDGNPVVLLKVGSQPSNCKFISPNGNVLSPANYVGNTNGNRATYRSTVNCNALGSNTIFSCNNFCLKINGSACSRHD